MKEKQPEATTSNELRLESTTTPNGGNTVTMNTPDTEWEKEFDEQFPDPMEKRYGKGFALYCSYCDGTWRDEIKSFIHHQLQKARQDWLRSEIEKLDGIEYESEHSLISPLESNRHYDIEYGFRMARASIITRHKEELKVLEDLTK